MPSDFKYENGSENMELNEAISKLNYKYQFVKNNKYWNYNQIYSLSLNNDEYSVSENDILLGISHNIAKNVDGNFISKNSMSDYEIPNINIEYMKNIVKNFFLSINPNLSTKVEFVLSHTNFIQYNDNIPSDKQRSVTSTDGIKLYYKNDLQSLVTLAHEISHGISSLDNNCKISSDNKIDSFAEIESELTEDIFLDYLKNNNLQIKEKKTDSVIRSLNDNDIDSIKYNKYKSAVFLSYRAIDELEFKNLMKAREIKDIDEDFINELVNSTGLNKNELVSRIDKFVNEYYPDDDLVHDYIGKQNYDLKNGKHLSNESRFIYAYCFVEKFNGMNLDYEQKCKFYNNYLENAKNMSFQNVLESFGVDLHDLNSFSDEFISKFNELSNKDNSIHKHL